ncbi:hypothetical protein GF339_02715 [candidate division KSB3 bacterium]|uniref:Uncharacterized protein n=1 Tax=candidate division KSB3 bacterium TaxID=2044937 RepID=A0A9D5JT30_9BACT|nr:hypothetical protein [candidate division KSB3 bacterium]MBD3323467.1 hypothetical protein [candidate division KSB3 bacterium]
MQAYRLEATLEQEGRLTLTDLPFHQGDLVEIIILRQPDASSRQPAYPLRGTVLSYVDPTDPVAQDDWEIAS